uniref:Uncharacterized protein n=1 Tax=Utricularia reniformis TaxID=192314 RepID=A0A1Y0B3M1_9LAMI|nr:hypothetical protein AEK19_MT1812 [Utricularia reniformis]ART31983.1 hypothetical protein AEK19_MT1812 [Utricularia reniformis]
MGPTDPAVIDDRMVQRKKSHWSSNDKSAIQARRYSTSWMLRIVPGPHQRSRFPFYDLWL